MKKDIPIGLMLDLMKCAEEEGTLEKIDEGECIRAKGMFMINKLKGIIIMENKETLEDKEMKENDIPLNVFKKKDVKKFIQEFIDERNNILNRISKEVSHIPTDKGINFVKNQIVGYIIPEAKERADKLAKQKFGGLVK